MPIMGGFALLKKLRDDPRTREMPVIVLSAEDPVHARAASGGLTPDAFVMKSDDMQPLIDAVVRVLAERVKPAEPNLETLQTVPANRVPQTPQKLQILLKSSVPKWHEVLIRQDSENTHKSLILK